MKKGDRVYYRPSPYQPQHVAVVQQEANGETLISISGSANTATIKVPTYQLSLIPVVPVSFGVKAQTKEMK